MRDSGVLCGVMSCLYSRVLVCGYGIVLGWYLNHCLVDVVLGGGLSIGNFFSHCHLLALWYT